MNIRRRNGLFVTIIILLAMVLAACEMPSPSAGDVQTVPDSGEVVEEGGAVEETADESAAEPPAGQEEAPAASDAAGETGDAGETAGEEAAPPAESGESGEEAADSPRPEDEEAAAEGGEAAGDGTAAEGEDTAAAEDASTTEESSAETADAAEESGDDGTAAEESTATDSGETGAAAAEDTAAAAETTTAEIPENGIHVVQAGETLYQIGLRYGYSWVVLAQFNNLFNANAIQAGQELRIPPRPGAQPDPLPTPEPNPTDETTYTVRPGDNLYLIGLIYGIDWPQIAEANGLVNPNRIIVGQTLKIPADQPGDAPEFTHVVQRGETLFLISLRYGVTWTAIAEKNELDTPYVIYPDQTLIIPANS